MLSLTEAAGLEAQNNKKQASSMYNPHPVPVAHKNIAIQCLVFPKKCI